MISTIPVNAVAVDAIGTQQIVGGAFYDMTIQIAAGTVTVETTLSAPEDIDAGTAVWTGGNQVGPLRMTVAAPYSAVRFTAVTLNPKATWVRK